MESITTGTEKQNQYAEDLRQDVYADLDQQMQAHGHTADDMIANNEQVAAIFAIEDHRFWIDVAGAYPKSDRTIRAIAGDSKTTSYL